MKVCSICGRKGVPMIRVPEKDWLDRDIPDVMCEDREECRKRYDEITREEGWL